MRQRKPSAAAPQQEALVNPECQSILTTINNATFTPYVEPVKCTSLYSEAQLQKTCSEAVAESLNGLVDEDQKQLLKELHHHSNIGLALGLFQVIAGGSCCLLPFKTTPHWIILLLAGGFFIGALITLFFDWFVTDGVVMTVDDTRLAGHKHRADNGLTVICHFDKKTKSIRLALAPGIKLTDSISLATRKAKKLVRTFHLFLYHVLWRVQTSGIAIAARQKDESLKLANVSPISINEDDDGGCWQWVDTPGSIPTEQQFGCFSDVVKFSTQEDNSKKSSNNDEKTKKETTNRASDDKSRYSGLILERPVTRYFDCQGVLLAEALNKDLKSLLVRYYTTRLDSLSAAS